MKQTRRRRPLRPRLSRGQVHQQLAQLRRGLQLFRTEWLLEAQQDSLVSIIFVSFTIASLISAMRSLTWSASE